MDTLFFDRSNGRIAYEEKGEGKLIILSPSLGDVRSEYRFLTPLLVQAGFRVISMDLRGHGESSTNWDEYSVSSVGSDLIALIRHLDSGPAIIVGTSLSGGAAVWAAAENPELVSAIVLVNAFVRDTMPIWQTKLLFTPLFAGPWGATIWKRYYTSLYPTNKPADFNSYLDNLAKNLSEPGRMQAAVSMMTTTKKASEERLSLVDTPTMIIMGTKDPDFKDPQAEAQFLASRLPGASEIHYIEGAGHYPQAEMPEKTAELLVKFTVQLNKVDAHVS